MADHTESSGTVIVPYRTHYGPAPIRGFRESTASTFAYGALVQMDQDAATNVHRVEVASSLSTAYLGVAADAASSNQDRLIPVYVADKDAEFLAWYKGTLASSLAGVFRTFARDTTRAIDIIDTNSSAADARIQITEVGVQNAPGGPYDIGDTNGYLAFRFLPEFTVFGKST